LLWLDAHGDFHTYETTVSGHLGGMPLAMISGRGEQEILARVGLTPISDDHICHVGARDCEAEENAALCNSGIVMSGSLFEAAAWIPPASTIWIHFDTDYVNPLDAPAMRYPAPGGPRAEQVRNGLAIIAKKILRFSGYRYLHGHRT
jgi:arginase